MAQLSKVLLETEQLSVVADRGYYRGEEILDCERAGITAYLPKPQTSVNLAKGLFGKRNFIYSAEDNTYRCPAGEQLIWRFQSVERGQTIHKYWSSACPHCAIKAQCTTGDNHRVTRWENKAVLEKVERRLDNAPEMMRLRRQTVEHPFGTLKSWMGHTHFLTKTLDRVSTEMSPHVLVYNFKRVINILGTKPVIEAIQA